MPRDEQQDNRRHRILQGSQGRRLDEAYLHQDFRDDLRAEAEAGGDDPLITPEILAQLDQYLEEQGSLEGPTPDESPGISRALFSTEAVLIVPGFLASTLSDVQPGGYGLVWVDPSLLHSNALGALRLGPYDGNEADANPDVRIVATGSLPIVYDLLRMALELRRYTTAVHALDWRRDLEQAARGLIRRLREMSQATPPLPVSLLAHSQGAIVALRAVQLLGESEARRLVKRLILLGPAQGGSYSAPMGIAGVHGSIALLRRWTIEPATGFARILASMSGLYQLFPWNEVVMPWLTEAEHAIGNPAFWDGAVDTDRLTRFHGWARQLDCGFFRDRITVILGDFGPTTAGVKRAKDGSLTTTHTLPGDGTVPHSCAVLPGVRTFLAEGTEHAMMPTMRSVIEAVRDILAERPVMLEAMPSDPLHPVYRAH